jgi:ABC-type spermidine/putrescine transport system permease subunit I
LTDNHKTSSAEKNAAMQRTILRAVGVAVIAGLGGFPAAMLLVAAVLGGRQLDSALGTKPLFTLGLMCLAVPLGILGMIGIAGLAARTAKRLNQSDHELMGASPAIVEEDDS